MLCTTTMTHLDFTLDDVPSAVRFFRDVLALPVQQRDDRTALVRLSDDLTARLSAAPAGRAGAVGPGPMIQLQVAHVRTALEELHRRGATVLLQPVHTEWGTESAFVAGPENVVVELYRRIDG